MELGAADLYELTRNRKYLKEAVDYSIQEPVTPWMGADTARHYQWYPFHNFGHYEIANSTSISERKILINYYKDGIEKVWRKASRNAFYRGVPFIWCSNNLTTSFTIQCYLYRKLSGDRTYEQLEQACFDWLFGCNPWGKAWFTDYLPMAIRCMILTPLYGIFTTTRSMEPWSMGRFMAVFSDH
jgi:hypothetical protein